MKLSRFIILTIFSTMVLISCGKKPSNVLSEKQMIAVFEDLYIVDAMMKNRRDDFRSDEYKDALINGVLSKHGISQADLDSSLVWYADNISIYSEIQDTVSARLQKRYDVINDLQQKTYSFKLTGFDVTLPEHYTLNVNTPTFRFNIDSTKLESFGKDKWEFSFLAQGIDTTLHRVESTIYYKYKDTIVVDKKKLFEDSLYTFEKPQLADSLLKGISGYVHMVMATEKMPSVFLCNIRNTNIDLVNEIDSLKDVSNSLFGTGVY